MQAYEVEYGILYFQGKENTFTDLPETLELLIQMEKASVEELSLKIKVPKILIKLI